VDPAVRRAVPVLVAVRVARQVILVATIVDLVVMAMTVGPVAMVMTVVGRAVRVVMAMTVGPVAMVIRAHLVVMVTGRIVRAGMARVLVAPLVRVVMATIADPVAMVIRAHLVVMVTGRIVRAGMARVQVAPLVRVVMATIVGLVAMVIRAHLVVMVTGRIVRVGMARVRVVRRDVTASRVVRVVMVTTVGGATLYVDRVSPATKPSVAAWRCAPKAAVPRARISNRRARSAWPSSGSMRARWTPPNCVTPPRRRPSVRPDRRARTVNSTPR